jgi:Flp pilus assembly pilin Flp
VNSKARARGATVGEVALLLVAVVVAAAGTYRLLGGKVGGAVNRASEEIGNSGQAAGVNGAGSAASPVGEASLSLHDKDPEPIPSGAGGAGGVAGMGSGGASVDAGRGRLKTR